MSNKIRNIIDSNLERVAAMALFATTFVVVGYLLPILYTQYLDDTKYVEIAQPVSTEYQEYKRGDNLGLILKRSVLITASAKQTTKIVHVNGETVSTQLGQDDSPRNVLLTATNNETAVTKTNTLYVPCSAIPGSNYMEVLFTYNIRGVEKTYSYISEVFQVLDEDSERCQ